MIYAITAQVETITIRSAAGKMRGFCVIPEFYVKASSPEKAEQRAREIIDPLQMTGVTRITVRELKKKGRKKK